MCFYIVLILCHVWELYFVFSETKQAPGITCEKTRKSLFLIKPDIYFPCNSIVNSGFFFWSWIITSYIYPTFLFTRPCLAGGCGTNRVWWSSLESLKHSMCNAWIVRARKPRLWHNLPSLVHPKKKMLISCIIGYKGVGVGRWVAFVEGLIKHGNGYTTDVSSFCIEKKF